MKRFITNIIVFTILLYFTAAFFDKIISIGLMKSETKIFYSLKNINEGKINADIIINGSSKAFKQVDPVIIDTILGVNSYNLGLDGGPFIPQRAQYEIYKLKNIKPKVIIQIVSNGTLRSLKDGFKDPIKFAPFLNISEVKKNMKLTGSFNYWDYHIPMLRYSYFPFEIITGTLSFFNIQLFKTKDLKGYSPENKFWSEKSQDKIGISNKIKEIENSNNLQKVDIFTSLDSISCENFESFIAECRKDKINVILVYPPIYTEADKTIKHIEYFDKIAKKYNIPFLNYSRDSLLVYNRNYFYNSQHLNIKGASVFTKKLSEDIKSLTNNTLNRNKKKIKVN
ncbi:MAG: hypothetical protein GW772_02065 [Flavobacteriia bacterium]|nr:hypothetical protein [Flavobacteriia bacterium]OIP47583.1 MAG: hypothetical protein AUK46_04815 [Flavobacteriaceae bacterium CG2_30_31_66]